MRRGVQGAGGEGDVSVACPPAQGHRARGPTPPPVCAIRMAADAGPSFQKRILIRTLARRNVLTLAPRIIPTPTPPLPHPSTASLPSQPTPAACEVLPARRPCCRRALLLTDCAAPADAVLLDAGPDRRGLQGERRRLEPARSRRRLSR